MISCIKTGENGFKVFNAILGTDSPDIDYRITLVYENAFNLVGQDPATSAGLDNATSNVGDSRAIPAWANHTNQVMIDIERWQLWPWVTGQAHDDNVAKYAAALQGMKTRLPGEQIGTYGVFPQGGIAVADQIQNDPVRRADWEAHNQRTATAITGIVDFLSPPYYSFYKPANTGEHQLRIDQWKQFVDEHNGLAASMMPGVPVYPLVWPQYHQGGNGAYQYVETDIWQAQLEHIKANCDGVVLWGVLSSTGAQVPSGSWDGNTVWWQTFKQVFNIP